MTDNEGVRSPKAGTGQGETGPPAPQPPTRAWPSHRDKPKPHPPQRLSEWAREEAEWEAREALEDALRERDHDLYGDLDSEARSEGL